MKINLNNKRFKALENSKNGEVSSDTIFHYRQNGNIVWATYEGGEILFGTLSGTINEDKMIFTYQHQNVKREFLTGKCQTTIYIVENKIQLHKQ